jgi:hypothetical protein
MSDPPPAHPVSSAYSLMRPPSMSSMKAQPRSDLVFLLRACCKTPVPATVALRTGVTHPARSLRMPSASFSATATTVQCRLARGIVGKTEASATRSPATP